MKFTLKEICKAGSYNPDPSKLESWQKRNAEDLIRKINNVGLAFTKWLNDNYPGKKSSRTASSFARDYEAQKKINPTKMLSGHLFFGALDIADTDGLLKEFLKTTEGQQVLIEQGLWCEDFEYTPTWVHLQLYSVNSGNRFFKP